MALAYLYDPLKQWQDVRGVNNVNGWLEVFVSGTQERAVAYSDFGGTLLPDRIGIDNDGRAVVIVDSEKAYRVEVHTANGDLLFTQYPVWTQQSGGGVIGSFVDIESSNGSLDVQKTVVGATTIYDLSVATDSTEGLDWIRTNGYTTADGKLVPTYQEGPMEVGEHGIALTGGRYYHVTARLSASVTAMPYYNEFAVTFSGMKDGGDTESYLTRNFVADCSTELSQQYEVSFDVMPAQDVELFASVSGLESGVSVGLLDIEVHRVYSGIPDIPDGMATKDWVLDELSGYMQSLVAGPGIELSGSMVSVDFDEVQGKLTAGTGIDITDDTVSVDFSEVQAKLEAGANIVIDGNTISATAEPQLNADWDATSGVAEILNKPDLTVYAEKSELAQVAFSGAYADLSGTPDLSVYATLSDLDGKQDTLTAGDNITITNNVISATAEPQVNADWDATSGVSQILNKPDLSVYATEAELSGYQEVLTPGTGIDITNNTISVDTTTIATQSDLSTGLAGKQDTLTAGDNITITNNVISAAAEPQVNADWDATSGVSEILNKPTEKELVAGQNITLTESGSTVTISAAGGTQVNADWDATSGVAQILNKPDLSIYAQSANLATVATTGDYDDLLNKPAIPAAQVNSDWDATSGAAEILNKPTIRNVPASTSADASKVLTVDSNGDAGWETPAGLFVAMYGQSTFTEIKNAFLANKIVYCAVPINTAYRMAFLAYAYPQSNFEFQYVRSNSSAAGTDSVFVYKVNSDNTWTTAERTVKAGNISYPVTQVNVNGSSAMSGTVANITVPAQVNTDWDATSGVSQLLNKPDLSIYAESSSLSPVATSGSYNDLTDTPTIPEGIPPYTPGTDEGKVLTVGSSTPYWNTPAEQVNADWDATSGKAQILNKPDLSIYAQSSSLSTVATTGDYDDLLNKPTIPAAQVNSDWDATSGISEILHKPDLSIYAQSSSLSTVATTGDYDDLLNKPSIPAAQVNSDWDATSGVAEILNKPEQVSLVAGSNITITEGASTLTISSTSAPQVNADWDATSGVQEILNKPDLVDIVAGPGIVVDNPDGNTLRVSMADSGTVLWSGSLNATGITTPLSESIYNFEMIDVYCWPNKNYTTQRAGQVSRFTVPTGTTSAFFYCRTENLESGTYYSEIIYVNVSSGTTMQLAQGHRWQDNTQTKSIDSYRGEVFKIVGVHRIANN